MTLSPLYIVIGSVLIVASIILICVVLLQQSREAGLSGAISGAADTFFGKNKSRTLDAKLANITKVLGVIFFVGALVSVFVFAFLSGKLA